MKKTILTLVFLVLVLAVSLCVVPSIVPSVAQGTLQLKITDKVENVTSLTLNINEIRVHKAGIVETEEPINETQVNETEENETQGTETNETETAEWITVFSGPKTIDLIAVKGVEQLLGEAKLDAGKYTQIRLAVDNATVIINETSYDVNVPSKTIKFVHPFNIEANKTTSLIFDFDADKSIVEAGKKDKYILKPVVKVITEFEGE